MNSFNIVLAQRNDAEMTATTDFQKGRCLYQRRVAGIKLLCQPPLVSPSGLRTPSLTKGQQPCAFADLSCQGHLTMDKELMTATESLIGHDTDAPRDSPDKFLPPCRVPQRRYGIGQKIDDGGQRSEGLESSVYPLTSECFRPVNSTGSRPENLRRNNRHPELERGGRHATRNNYSYCAGQGGYGRRCLAD